MATFGDLVVRLNLDKRGFDAGVGGARGNLSALKSIAMPAAAAIGAISAAAIGAAVAFKAWLAPAFEALDTLGDLSKRLGVATDSLAGLQHAAKLAGVDQDGLTIGIQKFLDTLSNASVGTASAVKAFDALGLKAGALKDLSLEQQFIAVADALKNVQNPADRVRIALDLFGKSGAQMLQLLADGSGDLTAALKEARALGIAPKPEDVAKIQEANDALDRMQAAWKGIANTLAIEVAPTVESVANSMRMAIPDAIANIEKLSGVWRGFAANQAATWLTLREVLKGNVSSLEEMVRLFKLIESATLKGMRGMRAGPGKELAKGKGKGATVPNILDSFGKGIVSERNDDAKNITRDRGQLRQTTAPGGIKGAADTLGRILRAGSASKDPVVKAVKDETSVIKGMAKDIKKLATSGMGGGLIVGAVGAGV